MNAKLESKKTKDYIILCRSNLDLPSAHIAKLRVVKEYPYNNNCVVVMCDNNASTDDAQALYVYNRGGDIIYKYQGETYFEITKNSYDLMDSIRGLHLTEYDVANFARKIKSNKEHIQNEAARYYGNPSYYFNSNWRPIY